MKKKNGHIDEDLEFDSMLNEEDREYLNILDEVTDEVIETVEVYEGYVRLITHGVMFSDKLSHNLESLANRLNSSLKKDKEYLEFQVQKTLRRALKCNAMISEHIMGLYEHCESINRYWHNCSLETYQNYYPQFLDGYKQKFSNADNLDFLKVEYEYFLKLNTRDKTISSIHNAVKEPDELVFVNYFNNLNSGEQEFFQIETRKKLDFIANEILQLGYHIQLGKTDKEVHIILIPEKDFDFDKLEEEKLDIAQLPTFNLIERFELLKEIGVYDSIMRVQADKKSLNKLLALVLGCSVVNARKLLDGTYKVKNREQKRERQLKINEKIKDFLINNNIKLKD